MISVENRRAPVEDRGALATARDLAIAVLAMLRNTAQMAGTEARLVFDRFAVRAGFFVAWLVVGALGVLVLLAGVAWFVAESTGMRPWLAMILFGALVAGVGAFAAKRALKSLSHPELGFRATLRELETDAAALQRACEDVDR